MFARNVSIHLNPICFPITHELLRRRSFPCFVNRTVSRTKSHSLVPAELM
jgi:hypothetical protein